MVGIYLDMGLINNKQGEIKMVNRRAGFTMIELIMVVIIVAVLASLALPQYVNFVEKARVAEATNYIGVIKSAQVVYAAEKANGYYSPDLATCGITVTQTPLWNFATVGSTNASFTATATRNGGTQDTKTVILTYTTASGAGTWSGTHTGAPKN
jgi:prepilin-type N-terminal cleavage/methylation domain-containing protein